MSPSLATAEIQNLEGGSAVEKRQRSLVGDLPAGAQVERGQATAVTR